LKTLIQPLTRVRVDHQRQTPGSRQRRVRRR